MRGLDESLQVIRIHPAAYRRQARCLAGGLGDGVSLVTGHTVQLLDQDPAFQRGIEFAGFKRRDDRPGGEMLRVATSETDQPDQTQVKKWSQHRRVKSDIMFLRECNQRSSAGFLGTTFNFP